MPEEECFEVVETCLEHPNIEVIQIAERINRSDDSDSEEEDEDKSGKGKFSE